MMWQSCAINTNKMKIEFFKKFTFAELLKVRDSLCRYQPTQDTDIDLYIGTDKHTNTAHSRTERCVRLIDIIIVAMAVKGELIEVPETNNHIDLYNVQVSTETDKPDHGFISLLLGFDQFYVRYALDCNGGGSFYNLYDQDKKHLSEIWCDFIDFNQSMEDLKKCTNFGVMIECIVDFIYSKKT